jgi:outer membrane protein TolC
MNPRCLAMLAFAACLAPAQSNEVSITAPPPVRYVQPVLRPFHVQPRIVAPAKLTNSPRLDSLIRGGNLYLTAQDVIAAALENNVDIAIQRYGPALAREVLQRAQGGGALRSIGVSIAPGPISVSTAGVSVSAVGLGDTGGGVSSGGGITSSIGTTPPTLDPVLFASANFSHQSIPLSVTAVSLIPTLITGSRNYQIGYAQSFVTGTYAQLAFSSSRYSLNSPANLLNPYVQGDLDFFITQNLLQGWGKGTNDRYIRIARNNLKVTDLQFQQQVITTVSAILNLYWDLVSFNQDRRVKQKALETAQQLYQDNQNQVRIGTLPEIEVTRAAAQVSSSQEDLLISETNVAQQEIVLKNALSRTGIASDALDEIHIIPLDSIVVPEKEDVRPANDLIAEALQNRPEIEKARINLESTKISTAGTRNALLPTLQVFAELTNNGLAGDPNPLRKGSAAAPAPSVVGGYGSFVGQLFRRDYPNYSAGFSLNVPFRNRIAQADYVADQLSLRQTELQLQKAVSQIRVDVKTAVIGLQQARARYDTSVSTRVLAEQTLEAEQNRFMFAEATIADVVAAQRDLAADQTGEIQAMANYTHAKIAFDEAVGQTLDVNHISIAEARAGEVARQSSIPEGAK